ncbi:MAG: tRNA (adenosine(37)-N6)-dimethylallyltransferase MiaA [Thermodesulfovibrionia bacterium]|nr:tRNA (adenosine(37)-N6)-dimethylallyltransferase MiaA [Thermodesulfovibrionia bacterium]
MNKVIIILGPTGVGKTGLSILLAKKLDSEIISADSMVVYRNMDIGTAKPSPAELKEVKHHLINIATPDETFSAGVFKRKATDAINELHCKNKIPVIAGGTGLYIRSLTRGLFEGPGADWPLRKYLMEEERRHGNGHLLSRLQTVDPAAARGIDPNDIRRIVRALEVFMKEKKGISEVRQAATMPLEYDFIKIGLSRERKELYRLIEDRVDKMMEDGLLEETKRLLEIKPNRTAMQALGYKEMRSYLDGEVNLAEAVRLIKKRTKMYAKRQYTWFRKEPDISWIDITGVMDANKICEMALNEVEFLRQLIYSN